MNLSEVKSGDITIILSKNISKKVLLRPYVMGLVPGAEVKCLSTTTNSIELNLYGTRMVISKELASKYNCKKIFDI